MREKIINAIENDKHFIRFLAENKNNISQDDFEVVLNEYIDAALFYNEDKLKKSDVIKNIRTKWDFNDMWNNL